MRKGSALLLAIWIIAVLSVMVLSFSYEARQQAGVNVYVRERNRVNRLIEPGRIIGETILLGYSEAKAWSEDEQERDLDKEDRWYKEKRALKFDTRVEIGPILMDEDDPDSGTVTVEIEQANSGAENGINVNELFSGGDKNYQLRWQMILTSAGIDEELEVEVKDADGRGSKKHNLINHLIACWNDWRDEDDSVSRGPLAESDYRPQDDDGAESAWYKEFYETQEKDVRGSRKEREAAKEDRRFPRNGSIPDIKELAYVRGFKDFPSVLTGGYLYDGTEFEKDYEKDRGTEANPQLRGIANLLGTSGSAKITITPNTTVEQLLTLPGFFPKDLDSDADREDSRSLAEAVLTALKTKPEDYDVDESRDWWPFKDWDDLKRRVEDVPELDAKFESDEAKEYIEWQTSDKSVFKMKITGTSSMGIKREVTCECYVNTSDKKVRYTKWRED